MSRSLIEKLPFRVDLAEKLLELPIPQVRQWVQDTHHADIKERTLYLWRSGLKSGKIKIDNTVEMLHDPTHDLYLIKMKRVIKGKEDEIEYLRGKIHEIDAKEYKNVDEVKAYKAIRILWKQDITTAEKIVFQFYKEMYVLTRQRSALKKGRGEKSGSKLLDKIAPDGFKKPEKTDREILEEMGPEALEEMRADINRVYGEEEDVDEGE